MKIRSSTDLLFDQLRDLYSVETQLVEALPPLVAVASHGGLKTLLEAHTEETVAQWGTLSAIFKKLGVDPGSDKCRAMAGLIKGGSKHLEKVDVVEVRDLMLIAHCLRIEQYEIAAYEITLALANRTGPPLVAAALEELLEQERSAKQSLNHIEPEVFNLTTLQPSSQ